MPALKSSFPAYEFLRQLTAKYQRRGPKPSEIYEDPRNEHLLVWIGAPEYGRLYPRSMAAVSPWDSSVQGGDAGWEGIRVYRGKILSLDKHLKRLMRSAKALGFKNVHTKEQVTEAIFQTLAANGMRNNAHMRLTLTRGEKCTSSMNPEFNVYGTTLVRKVSKGCVRIIFGYFLTVSCRSSFLNGNLQRERQPMITQRELP